MALLSSIEDCEGFGSSLVKWKDAYMSDAITAFTTSGKVAEQLLKVEAAKDEAKHVVATVIRVIREGTAQGNVPPSPTHTSTLERYLFKVTALEEQANLLRYILEEQCPLESM